MFSEELERVIEAALADGVLTDKEREVLHKRAAAEGVDPDELDVVIDGRLAKMKREEDWLRPAPPSDKFGDVKKCPRCGETVEPMAVKCSACGYEFRNVSAVSSAQKLVEKLEEIDNKYKKARADDLKPEAIRNFPIPNAKEDLLEFVVSMKARWINTPYGYGEGELKKSYKAKYDESVAKAKLLFPDDPQFVGLFNQAKKDDSLLSKVKNMSPTAKILLICFIIWALLMIGLALGGKLK